MSENALLLVLLMSAVSSFVFLLLDPDHREGTKSAFRDIWFGVETGFSCSKSFATLGEGSGVLFVRNVRCYTRSN